MLESPSCRSMKTINKKVTVLGRECNSPANFKRQNRKCHFEVMLKPQRNSSLRLFATRSNRELGPYQL